MQIEERKKIMPYIKDEDKVKYGPSIEKLATLIEVKGDFNYVMCELVGQLILKGKIGYTQVSEWIDAMVDAGAEARRRLLDPYEDIKIIENGDVPSWKLILQKMKETQ